MTETGLPTLMDCRTDEEFTAKTLKYARYFSIIRCIKGGFRSGGANYQRHEAPTLDKAREIAHKLREEDNKNTVIIYAIADFIGAMGFSRPIEFYPKSDYKTRADREREAKEQKRAVRDLAREARLNMGNNPRRSVREVHQSAPTSTPEGFDDAEAALAYVTDD